MRRVCAITLLAAVSACTHYQPLAWSRRGDWAEARAASARVPAAHGAAAPAERPPAIVAPDFHRVRAGDTLAAVAARHGLAPATLARANGMAAPFALRGGQFLRIPASGPALPPTTLPPAVIAVAERAPDAAGAAPSPVLGRAAAEATQRAAARRLPPLSGEGFLWPAKGALASDFGEKPNGARNNGINITAAEGSAVLAAENGIVVYAGTGISGYGNMLLISHAKGFITAYAHNRDLRVQVGEMVARGETIATVGATGGIGLPQLHFEIRAGKKPLDPMLHLAGAQAEVASTR